jgi:hypothetical protein
MNSQTLTVIGTLGGVVIGSFGTFLVTWISKKYEYKRELKKMILDVAIKEWKEGLELLEKRGGGKIMPLFSFVIFASDLLNLLEKKKRGRKEIEELLAKAKEISEVVHEYTKKVKDARAQNMAQESS